MSLASREALNKLINRAEVAQFATHAEDWSTCSTTAVLAASVDELGKLTEQRDVQDHIDGLLFGVLLLQHCNSQIREA